MTLLELGTLLKKHLKLVILLPIICALATAVVSWVFLPNTYTSDVSMYVLSRSSDSSSTSITNTELTASQMLTNDMAKLVKSDRVKNDTASKLQLKNLSDYTIKITSETTTRVITVSVTGTSAQGAAIVANGLAETTDSVAREVMDVKSVNIIDKAVEESTPSGPPRLMYTGVGFLAGLFLAIAFIVIRDMTDTRVRNADELEELLDVPVIGRIPEIR